MPVKSVFWKLLLAVFSCCAAGGGMQAAQGQPVEGQLTATQAAVQVRNGPFSQLFRVGPAYVVKDKDYNPSEPQIRFASLWIDVPSRKALEVAVGYCVPETDIATENAALTEMVLLDADRPLVHITRLLAARDAQQKVVRQPRYVPPTVVGPLGYGFGRPYGFWGGGYVADPGTFLPAVECSAGSSRFDLTPVRRVLARLSARTLKVQLLFNNGAVQNWQLGAGTVAALKQLPSLRRLAAGG
jgi:hypothetical protein